MAKDIPGPAFMFGQPQKGAPRTEAPISLSALEHRVWTTLRETAPGGHADWTWPELERHLRLKKGQAKSVLMRLALWGLAKPTELRRVGDGDLSHRKYQAYEYAEADDG